MYRLLRSVSATAAQDITRLKNEIELTRQRQQLERVRQIAEAEAKELESQDRHDRWVAEKRRQVKCVQLHYQCWLQQPVCVCVQVFS